MSFTFDDTLADDVSLVRFHVGDTDSDGYYLEDGTIQYFVTAGSVGSATLACIKYIITQLSKPNFKLDWLAVSDMQEARKGYEQLLTKKAQEFGLSPTGITVSGSISMPYRADSGQDSDEDVYDGSSL